MRVVPVRALGRLPAAAAVSGGNSQPRPTAPFTHALGLLLLVIRDFEVVQSTHDPNALAVFLAHQPYHVDGLLTLAMLFAHTGR